MLQTSAEREPASYTTASLRKFGRAGYAERRAGGDRDDFAFRREARVARSFTGALHDLVDTVDFADQHRVYAPDQGHLACNRLVRAHAEDWRRRTLARRAQTGGSGTCIGDGCGDI